MGVFDPNGAVWFVKLSGGGTLNLALGVFGSSQVPVPADYDNDAKADVGVWNPSNGLFVVKSSAVQGSGTITNRVGSSIDTPVEKRPSLPTYPY